MVGEWIVDSSVDPPSSDFRRRFALARRVGVTGSWNRRLTRRAQRARRTDRERRRGRRRGRGREGCETCGSFLDGDRVGLFKVRPDWFRTTGPKSHLNNAVDVSIPVVSSRIYFGLMPPRALYSPVRRCPSNPCHMHLFLCLFLVYRQVRAVTLMGYLAVNRK